MNDLICIEKMKTKEQRQEERRQRREQESRDIEASKQRMSEELGVPITHSKFKRAWIIAWQHGHASGIGEVENRFRELADLLKP